MSDDRHQHVAHLLSEDGPLAPPELRARIDAELSHANDPRRLRRPVAFRAALAGAAAACLAGLAVFLPAILGGDPTALDAHALAARGPTAPAPAQRTGSPQLLAADVDGVEFPSWEREFGWKASGQRTDELDGRRAQTVFYEHEGHTISYTVVSGAPLELPEGVAQHRRVDGIDIALLRDDHGHDIAVFERQGKTCVISAHVKRRATLIELARWSGDGRVEF